MSVVAEISGSDAADAASRVSRGTFVISIAMLNRHTTAFESILLHDDRFLNQLTPFAVKTRSVFVYFPISLSVSFDVFSSGLMPR